MDTPEYTVMKSNAEGSGFVRNWSGGKTNTRMRTIVKVTSRDNVSLKDARRVRDGKTRDKMFIEGARLVAEAIKSRVPIEQAFVSTDDGPGFFELMTDAGARTIYEVSRQAFESIADTVTSQGVVIIADRPSVAPETILERISNATLPLVLFLHRINNPSNLGAVIRTAEAAGAAAVVVSAESADAFSPKAIRASMGSAFRLPILQGQSFDDAIDWAHANHLRTTAADAEADVSHYDVDWYKPRMLVFGSEAHGLSDDERRRVDEIIKVPMEREVESLNLAVAAGVILFEARRSRQ